MPPDARVGSADDTYRLGHHQRSREEENNVKVLQRNADIAADEDLGNHDHHHEQAEEDSDDDHECRVVIAVVSEERAGRRDVHHGGASEADRSPPSLMDAEPQGRSVQLRALDPSVTCLTWVGGCEGDPKRRLSAHVETTKEERGFDA